MALLCTVTRFVGVVVQARGGLAGTAHVTGQTMLIKSLSTLLGNSEQRELARQGTHGLEGERSSETLSGRRGRT